MRERLAAWAAGGWSVVCALRRTLLLGAALSAGAAVLGAPADIARGVAWLQAQVQSQSLLAIDSLTASQPQARCEIANTLLKLAGNSAQVSALIASLQEPTGDAATESLACWQQMRQQLGQTILVSEVEGRRLNQQGYVPQDGFGVAMALDTGWALAAQLQNLGSSDKGAVLAWLQSSQAADGSFSVAGRANVLATAVIVRALNAQALSNASAAAIASKAATWLLSRQGGDGWLTDVATTSVVYEAVHPYTGSNPNIASTVNAYLLAQQGADGSWAGDAYVTAVALRALALTSLTPIDPTVAGTSATVRGVVTAAGTGQPLAGATLSVTQSGSAAKSVTSDVNGQFLIQGIAPGAASLSASLSGYQTASATENLLAGSTVLFSPALYANGAIPTAGGRVSGNVVAFGSNTVLSGVTVQAVPSSGPAVSATTDSGGHFDVAVPSGNAVVSFSLTGYTASAQQVIVTNGSAVNLGSVPLQPVRQTSTLRGTVYDFSGQPLAGATVQVGTTSATTNSGGAYSLGGLIGTSFTAEARAPGYATQSAAISAPQPGDLVQDFALPATGAGYLTLSDLQLSTASAGLRQDVTATVTVSNNSGQTASSGLVMNVVAPSGQVLATLAPTDANGNPILTTLLAGQATASYFKWNSAGNAAGKYQLIAKLFVPGTVTQHNPGGVALGSLRTTLDVQTSPHFSGSVTANPPVMQAGTSLPVALSALLLNDGNTPLPAQSYQLSVVDTSSGQTTYTQTISAAAIEVSQLQPLTFASWTPSAGGNFKVQVSSPSTPGSSISTTLYVGAAGQANWTVDKSVVPSGTQTVRGTINVAGTNTINGAVQDPLAPLVKQAIVTAVTNGDSYAYNHYLTTTPCFACHVQAQSIAGGEHSLKYIQPANPLRRAVLAAAISANISNPNDTSYTATGPTNDAGFILYSASAPSLNKNPDTGLGLWGLSFWHDPSAVNYTRGRLARYLTQAQNSDGSWTPGDSGSWWSTKAPLAALTLNGLISVKGALQTQGATFVGKKLTKVAISGSIPPSPYGAWRLSGDSNGNLFVTVTHDSLWKVTPNGVATKISSPPQPNCALPLPDGRILIGNDNGIYMRQLDGTITSFVPGLPMWNLQPMQDGTFLAVTSWWDGTQTMYKISLTGVKTAIGSSSLVPGKNDATQLPDGSVAVLNYSNRNIFRFDTTGQVLDFPLPVAPQTAGSLQTIMPYNGGVLLTTSGGLFFYDKNWIGQRWSHEGVFSSVSMPDGRLLVYYGGGSNPAGIYQVQDNPVDTTTLGSLIDTSVGKATGWLEAGIGVDQTSNVDLAFRLMGLADAKKYYQGTSRAGEFDAPMQSIGAILQGRQDTNGGWVWHQGFDTATDPMVTAMVGTALDALNPSPNSPQVRNAVQILLKAQQPTDGMWRRMLKPDGVTWINPGTTSTSPNYGFATPLIPSTWVELWLPTLLDRLAYLDSTLAVTLPANVTMTNPTQAPVGSTTSTDGSTTYQWTFTTASDSPGQVAFDLTLANMQVDEVRPVATQASLLFKNSFTGETVTQAVAVPTVAVTTNLTGTVATDKPVYTEADQATFTATVRNAGAQSRNAQVRFSVLDAAGNVVQVLQPPLSVSVEGGASASATAVWPTAGILAGAYAVKADLVSAVGATYASSTATFSVTASQQQASGTRIFTDRVSYSAAQLVQLTSRVVNSTSNTPLESVRAITDVRNAGGQSVFSRTESIEQLAAGGERQYGYSLGAGSLSAGNYSASLQLVNSTGSVLSQSAASFAVLGVDQTGVGLVGRLQVNPGVVLIGQATQLGLLATNTAAGGLTNVPVTVRVIDPVSGNVVASFSSTVADWAAGQGKTLAYSWTAAGSDDQVLVAAATAQVNGRDIALGQATVRLVGIPKLQVEPAQLNFTPIYVGENARQTVTVSSIGTIPASSLTLSIGGADASQFAIPQGGCAGASSLAVGATCTLTISWRPQSVSSQVGEVQIGYTGGESLSVALAGQAKPVIFTGTVAADSREVEAGQSVGLSYSVSNPAAVTSQMAGMLSVQSAGGQTVGTWPLDLNVGGLAIFAGGQPYATQPQAQAQAQTLTVVLSQNVGTGTAVLATTTFTVIDPPAPVDVNTGTKGTARILVLVSCPPGLGSADDAACVAQRAQAITNYLHALGYTAKVVTTREAFVAEMRCGSYNTYWISGGAIKLDEQSVGELREAVYRGEALWMDGVHDSRSQLLHDVAGVKEIGKLSTGYQVAQIGERVYPAQALATSGQVTKFELTSGVAQGLFTQISGNQAPVPAIVSNDYGRGKSLLFAFDLAAMLAADAMQADAQLRGFVSASASHAASGSPTLTLGDVTQLSASVSNTGTRTAAFRVEATLPEGLASIATSPTAQLTANSDGTRQAIWSFTLSGGASQEIGWLVRAMQTGSFGVPLSIYSLPAAGGNSLPQLRATKSFTLDVKDAQSLLQQAQAAVNALAPTSSSDKSNKTKAVNSVNQALVLYAQGNYEQAIVQWLAAADALIGIASVDTAAARSAVSMAIEASTDALCVQRCGSATCQ